MNEPESNPSLGHPPSSSSATSSANNAFFPPAAARQRDSQRFLGDSTDGPLEEPQQPARRSTAFEKVRQEALGDSRTSWPTEYAFMPPTEGENESKTSENPSPLIPPSPEGLPSPSPFNSNNSRLTDLMTPNLLTSFMGVSTTQNFSTKDEKTEKKRNKLERSFSQDVLLAGWVKKRGSRKGDPWKKRWISLRVEREVARLYYFKSLKVSRANGAIDFAQVSAIRAVPYSVSGEPWSFSVDTLERIFMFAASTEEDMVSPRVTERQDRWVKVMNEELEKIWWRDPSKGSESSGITCNVSCDSLDSFVETNFEFRTFQ